MSGSARKQTTRKKSCNKKSKMTEKELKIKTTACGCQHPAVKANLKFLHVDDDAYDDNSTVITI